jgi:hypothetical protein
MAPSGDSPRDELFGVLGDDRRRTALACLVDATAPLPLSVLAERVADREAEGATVDDLTVELHHVHVPRLRDVGLVRVDGEGVGRHVAAVEDLRERLGPLSAVVGDVGDGDGGGEGSAG